MSELRSIKDDILQIMDAAILLYDPENISEPVCLLEFEDGQLFDIFSSNAVLGRKMMVQLRRNHRESHVKTARRLHKEEQVAPFLCLELLKIPLPKKNS